MAKLMKDQLSMFDLMTSGGSHSAISSSGLESGLTPCGKSDGQTTGPSGPDLAHVNHIQQLQQIEGVGLKTRETFGLPGITLSGMSALSASLASKLTTVLHGSTERHLTWKVRALPSGRSIFRLVPSMRRTSVCEPILWPTPTVQDAENKAGPSQWSSNTWPLNVQAVAHSLETTERPENLEEFGALNPQFVCWLMGLPQEWDACGAMAMRSMHKRQKLSSKQ